MEALKIYESLSKPPKEALRPIQAGNLKGKTDINPQWRYRAMTETFGLVGLGWKYEIQRLWTEPGANEETLAFAQVAVYIRDQDTKEWSDAIVGIGGSKLTQSFNKGLTSNDEGYKMAVTDAFSTSLKMLGVAADIYAGKWDGSKYTESKNEGHEHQNNQAQKTVQNVLAGGPDTEEEKMIINNYLSSLYPDKNKIYNQNDCTEIGNMRRTKTAAEVIKFLAEDLVKRNQKWQETHQTQPQIEWDVF